MLLNPKVISSSTVSSTFLSGESLTYNIIAILRRRGSPERWLF
jgi:hypothetical protein